MGKKTIFSILAGMIFVQFLLHIPFLNNPPMGQHVWRQVVGHAMALNYHLEDDSFWSPRNDTRITDEDDGRIWHEFPFGYWLIGKSYDLTGYHDINARLIWLILSLFAIPLAYIFLRELGGSDIQSLLFSFFLTFVPYYFYYSITVVPNLHGLIWFLGGVAFISRSIREQKLNFRFLVGMLFITLATITKPAYLFFGLPILVLLVQSWLKNRNVVILWQSVVGGLIVGIPNYFVLRYAKALYDLAPLEQQVNTPMGPAHNPESFQELWRNLSAALTSSFLEMFVGYAAIPFFVVGVVLFFRGKVQLPNSKFWKYWMLSFVLFSCFFVTRFADHDYYITSTLPIAALFSTMGFLYLWGKDKHRKWAFILICLAPLVMVYRVHGRWSVNKQIPEEILSGEVDLSPFVPANDRIIVLGDKSPVTFLYFLRRKGVAEEPIVSLERVLELHDVGIRWVVVYKPKCDPSHLLSILNERGQMGRFTVYEIVAKR